MAVIWRRRGVFTVAIAAVLAVIVTGLDMRSSGRASASYAGDAYSNPPVVDTNPDPNIVETTITAMPAAIDIGGGVLASVLTFNGTVPGPEFRLKVGDTVIVHFQNNIAHATGIHWHGIELNNASDGTPISQNQVPPGGSFLYKFKVTRPGIYWYHPHHHSSTNQVFKGLVGAIIVSDPNEAALRASGTLPPEAQTKTMVLGDLTVCKAPGSNDAKTYNPNLPHVSGGPLATQASPWPVELCETAPIDEDGNPRAKYAAGDVPNIQKSGTSGRVNEGQTVLTNGINVGARNGTPSAPGPLSPGANLLNVQAGQGLRLQFVNTSAVRFFRLRLTTSTGTLVPLVRVGGQGGLLDNAVVEGGVVGGFDFRYGLGEILLDPGDRADVVAAIPPNATGVATLWTEDFQRTGGGYADIPTVPVAHFNVTGPSGSGYAISDGTPLRAATGDPVETLGAATASLLNPAAFTTPKAGMANQNITLSQEFPPAALSINNVIGSHETAGDYTTAAHPGSARYAANVPVGSRLELTVENTTLAHHPFHLHGFSIQPISLTKTGSPSYTYPYREFRDNIDIPDGYTLRFRVRLDDRPMMDGTTPGGSLGRWVIHCHIFFHAIFGMITEFNVVAPTGNERPYINADVTRVQGNASSTLKATGTFFDRDGNTVTLSASSGTIVNDSGSHWTWTRTGGTSGLVYVTATDSGGLRDQVAFETVVNQPPVVTASAANGKDRLPIAIHGTATDPEGAKLTTTWTYTKGAGVDPGATCTFGNAAALDTTITCTHGGTYSIALTASDGDNPPVMATAPVTVIGCSLLSIVPLTLPAASVGQAYALNLSASNANGTPTFAPVAGFPLPGGMTLSSAGLLSGTPTALGTSDIVVSVTDSATCSAQQSYRFDVNPAHRVNVAGDAGASDARLFEPNGIVVPAGNLAAFDSSFAGGVRVASADLTGDGVAETIVAPGPGGSMVRVFNGVTRAVYREFAAYPWTPADGVYVAAADVNGDGVPDIVTGAGGSPPMVRVFDGRSGALANEFLVAATSVTSGVRVAAGDVDGDGFAEIVTSLGPRSSPTVSIFSGSGTLVRSFSAYTASFTGGVYVAAGDVNGDGFADVITGAGPGGTPHVRVFNGRDATELRGFLAYDSQFSGGVRVAAGDLNGDGLAEVITGAGPGGEPRVRVFDGRSGANSNSFLAYPATFAGGVFVATQTPQSRMTIDAPAADATVSGTFRITGWAFNEPSAFGSSGPIHVWAYPVNGAAPVFLGAARPGDPRPDVVAVFGGQWNTSGFHVDVASLPAGTYNVVVYAFDFRYAAVYARRVVRIRVQ